MDFNELYVDTCSSASKLAANGDAENLKNLVELGKPTNGQDNKGWRALHYACYRGHIKCINILLKAADVDINAITHERQTALYLTCCSELEPKLKLKISELLLDSGADPNHENQKQYVTILNHVVSSGNIALAQLLLRFNVNVNEHDDKFGSTLNAAVKSDCSYMVLLITKQRLEYDFRNYSEQDLIAFFHLAVLQKNTQILKVLVKNPQCVMKINNTDRMGRTCLFLACTMKYREAVEILLDHGADCNIKGNDKELPVFHLLKCLEDKDLVSSDSLFGRMIKLTNRREFMRPISCQYSLFHRLPFYNKSLQIYNYLMGHLSNFNINHVNAPVDETVTLPLHRTTQNGKYFTYTPLSYCCDQMFIHKNYEIFHKMFQCADNINDVSGNKIPPLIAALGSRKVDIYIVEFLIKNGASIWIYLQEWPHSDYPISLCCLFNNPDPSQALELIFSIFIPPEFVITYDQILDEFMRQAKFTADSSLLHSQEGLNLVKSFLKVICSCSKYASSKFSEESAVYQAFEQLLNMYRYSPNEQKIRTSHVNECQKLYGTYCNLKRTPKTLERQASLQIRNILFKCSSNYRMPLFERVDLLFKEIILPENLKEKLLFR